MPEKSSPSKPSPSKPNPATPKPVSGVQDVMPKTAVPVVRTPPINTHDRVS